MPLYFKKCIWVKDFIFLFQFAVIFIQLLDHYTAFWFVMSEQKDRLT